MMSDKAIFLDRDGTIISDPGYINNPKQVRLLAGAGWALAQLKNMGYKLVVVSNQSGIARGIVTEKALARIHQRLEKLLEHEGAFIDGIYYCPYHPNGVVPKYRKESDLRKPNPGMLLKAAEELDIDLERSWMVGDDYRDITAGQRAGCRTILINSSINPAQKKLGDPNPDKKAVNIKEVVNIIKMFDRQPPPAPREPAIVEPVEPEKSQEQTPPPPEPPDEPDEPAEQIPSPQEPPETKTENKQPDHAEKTHRLLEEIVTTLTKVYRRDLFEEFTTMKLFAVAVQVMVLFCLVVSLVFLLDDKNPTTSVHTMIGYAIVLQLMVIAFQLMRNKK